MHHITGRPGPSRVTPILGVRRPAHDPLRAKLMGRLAALNELFRDAASVEAATAAIGWAALMLTGASRCAVFMRTQDGAVSCPWSLLLSDKYLGRLCTPGGPDSGAHVSHHPELACMDLAASRRARSTAPSIVEDVSALPAGNETREAAAAEGLGAFCSWPLGRDGRVVGAVVYFFDTPHVCGDQEREVVLALVLQASAALDGALAAEARTQMPTTPAEGSDRPAPPHRVMLEWESETPSAPGLARQIETTVGAQRPTATQHDVETVTAKLLTLQHGLQAEAEHLQAEAKRLQAEAERLRVDWTNLRSERERVGASQQELEAERAQLADMQRALKEEEERLTRARASGSAQTAAPEAGVQLERRAVEGRPARKDVTSPAAAGSAAAAVAAAQSAAASKTAPPAYDRKAPPPPAPAAVPNKPVEKSTPAGAPSVQLTKTTALDRAYLSSLEKYRQRVVRWAEATAAALRWSVNDIAEIREAAALLYGTIAPSRIDVPLGVAAILRHHEEYWDGTGKPDRLKGHEIPLGARVLAVTVAYAEMVIGRPGAPMLYFIDAKAALKRDAGTRFDPDIVAAFCRAVDRSS
jgi:HD domain